MAENDDYTTEWFIGDERVGENRAAGASRVSRWHPIPGGRALVVTIVRDEDSGWMFEVSDYDTRNWPIQDRFPDAESALNAFTAAARR